MVRRKISIAIAALAAAMFLYCGGEAAKHLLGDGGVVTTADAAGADGTCCVAPVPTRTRLSSGTLSGDQASPTIDVSGYHSLLVFASGCSFRLDFRDKESDVARIEEGVAEGGGEVPVVGPFVRVIGGCAGVSAPYVLVGSQ